LTGKARSLLTEYAYTDLEYEQLIRFLVQRFGPGERADVHLAELREIDAEKRMNHSKN